MNLRRAAWWTSGARKTPGDLNPHRETRVDQGRASRRQPTGSHDYDQQHDHGGHERDRILRCHTKQQGARETAAAYSGNSRRATSTRRAGHVVWGFLEPQGDGKLLAYGQSAADRVDSGSRGRRRLAAQTVRPRLKEEGDGFESDVLANARQGLRILQL